MAVGFCSSCTRLISISDIPGGNPTAIENPEKFAVFYVSWKSRKSRGRFV